MDSPRSRPGTSAESSVVHASPLSPARGRFPVPRQRLPRKARCTGGIESPRSQTQRKHGRAARKQGGNPVADRTHPANGLSRHTRRHERKQSSADDGFTRPGSPGSRRTIFQFPEDSASRKLRMLGLPGSPLPRRDLPADLFLCTGGHNPGREQPRLRRAVSTPLLPLLLRKEANPIRTAHRRGRKPLTLKNKMKKKREGKQHGHTLFRRDRGYNQSRQYTRTAPGITTCRACFKTCHLRCALGR